MNTIPRLSVEPAGGILLTALVAVGLLLLWGMVRPRAEESPRRRVLAALRLAVVLLALWAMLRPALVWTDIRKQPAVLAFILDVSRSMEVADEAGKRTRWEVLRELVDKTLPATEQLGEELEVKWYGMGQNLEELSLQKGSSSLPEKPKGKQTAIGADLEDLLRALSGKRMVAAVMASDGMQRALPPRDQAPQLAARRMSELGYPLFTVGFGQARGQGQSRDIALEQFEIPERTFVKNPIEAAGVLRTSGMAGQEFRLEMLWETSPGKLTPVAAKTFQPQAGEEQIPFQLQFTPETPGEFKTVLRVEPQPGEIVLTNNEIGTFVTVSKGGLNILYLEGELLRVEPKFLIRSIDASPDVQLDYFRLDSRDPNTRPPDLAERFQPGKYDVYIFGDVDSQAFAPEQLTALAQTVEQGAGFVMLGGLHSFGAGGYGQSPLADILPIEIERFERQNPNEPTRGDLHLAGPLNMRPTELGLTQSIMRIGDTENPDPWSQFPPLNGANRFRGLKPGANVLAETTQGEPLLVARDFGRGRTIAFAADSTWRWWMQGFEGPHRRFWRQTMLWLARKDESTEGNVWIRLDKRRHTPGERVEFQLGVNLPSGEPAKDPTFQVQVLNPGGQTSEVRLRRDADTWLGSFLETQSSGDYTIQVLASAPGFPAGTAKARFLVQDQDLEMENPAADRSTLENLANMTGGRMLLPEQLPELLDELKKRSEKLDIQVQTRTTLWDRWPFFLLFVGLISTEWYLRKRWGMV